MLASAQLLTAVQRIMRHDQISYLFSCLLTEPEMLTHTCHTRIMWSLQYICSYMGGNLQWHLYVINYGWRQIRTQNTQSKSGTTHTQPSLTIYNACTWRRRTRSEITTETVDMHLPLSQSTTWKVTRKVGARAKTQRHGRGKWMFHKFLSCMLIYCLLFCNKHVIWF